jgi:hypothetical protein
VSNNIGDKKYNYGNPNQIFLMGESAGAHLSGLVALNPDYLEKYSENLAGFIGLAG